MYFLFLIDFLLFSYAIGNDTFYLTNNNCYILIILNCPEIIMTIDCEELLLPQIYGQDRSKLKAHEERSSRHVIGDLRFLSITSVSSCTGKD